VTERQKKSEKKGGKKYSLRAKEGIEERLLDIIGDGKGIRLWKGP
jgi:hypothetical protein